MYSEEEYETIIDKISAGDVKLNVMERTGIDRESAKEVARQLLDTLHGYNYEIIHSDDIIIIRVKLQRFVILLLPLGYKRTLTGLESLKIFEKALKHVNMDEGKIVIIYYSPGGKLLTSAYLFLGHLIEKYKIGILFVNGGPEEVIEVLEALREKGEFTPKEEDYVKIV